MIKITGAGRPSAPERTRAANRSGAGAFRVGEAKSGEAGAAVADAAPVDVLSALIEIQSANERESSRRRRIAAAQRTLMLLDRLRLSLLEGTASDEDLVALASATASPGDVDDAALESVLGEIALRARVELAKRGR